MRTITIVALTMLILSLSVNAFTENQLASDDSLSISTDSWTVNKDTAGQMSFEDSLIQFSDGNLMQFEPDGSKIKFGFKNAGTYTVDNVLGVEGNFIILGYQNCIGFAGEKDSCPYGIYNNPQPDQDGADQVSIAFDEKTNTASVSFGNNWDPAIGTSTNGYSRYFRNVAKDSDGNYWTAIIDGSSDVRVYNSSDGLHWTYIDEIESDTNRHVTYTINKDNEHFVIMGNDNGNRITVMNTTDGWTSYESYVIHDESDGLNCGFRPYQGHRVTTDASGNLHLVWWSDRSHNRSGTGSDDYGDDWVFYNFWNTSSKAWNLPEWSNCTDLADSRIAVVNDSHPVESGNGFGWADVVVDSNNNVFVGYCNFHWDACFISRRQDDKTWSMSSGDGFYTLRDTADSWDSAMYIDSDDNLYFSLVDDSTLYLYNSTPSKWNTSWTDISPSIGFDITGQQVPIRKSQNALFVVYSNASTGSLYTSYSEDNGLTWTTDELIEEIHQGTSYTGVRVEGTNSESWPNFHTLDESAIIYAYYNNSASREVTSSFEINVSGGEEPPSGNGTNETDAVTAIDTGIVNALGSGYTLLEYHKVYARDTDNSQSMGTFDRVVKYGQKVWAINYISDGESAVGMFNMTPALYVLELSNMNESEITSAVESVIGETS